MCTLSSPHAVPASYWLRTGLSWWFHLPLCLQGDCLVMLALDYLHDASRTSKVNAMRFLRQLLGNPSVSCWLLHAEPAMYLM